MTNLTCSEVSRISPRRQVRDSMRPLFAETRLTEDTDQIYRCGGEVGRVRYIVEEKVAVSESLQVRAWVFGLPLNIVPASQALSELAGELK
jgi:hypothetical protein